MSAPKIRIVWDQTGHEDVPPAIWWCTDGRWDCAEGEAWSIAAAADAGRAHLAAHHTAFMPQVAHGDGDGANGAQNAAQPFVDFEQAINRAHNESREGA